MEDIVTVKRAINGDKKAFSQLIKDNKSYMYNVAYLHTKYEEDAKEVVQETVYRAYKNIRKLRDPKKFKSWLIRILINTSNDILSKYGMIDLEHDESSFIKEHIENENIEIKIDLYNAIDELDDKYKNIIILRYYEDLKVEDVAKQLDCPVNTAKTRISKALKVMKKLLKEGYIND